jgi:hypothetical protein
VWLLVVTLLVVVAMAAVWWVRRAKGAHHPDRGPSRTGRVAQRRPAEQQAGAPLPPDPGDARPAGPDAEAMGVPEPGQPGLAGDDAGREPRRPRP